MTGLLQFIFGPRPEGAEQKKGGSAEAGRPKGNMMLNVVEKQVHDNAPGRKPQPNLTFINEGLAMFTPDRAQTVLDHCRYDRQRDETKAKSHIAALAEQMRRGLWLPKTQIDFANVNGRKILVNGHHRMHAQIEAKANVIWNVIIHDCADDAEVASLYWKFDTTIRKRSSSNILEGIGFAESIDVSKSVATALWTATPILALGLRIYRARIDGEAVAQMMHDDRQQMAAGFAREAQLAQELIASAPLVVRKRMLVASRFAMMIAILRHQPETGEKFWRGFCEDDGLTKGDPRKTLLQDLQLRPHNAGLLAQHMMAIARAWNAFYHGRTMTHLKVTGSAIPVAGTPFTVKA